MMRYSQIELSAGFMVNEVIDFFCINRVLNLFKWVLPQMGFILPFFLHNYLLLSIFIFLPISPRCVIYSLCMSLSSHTRSPSIFYQFISKLLWVCTGKHFPVLQWYTPLALSVFYITTPPPPFPTSYKHSDNNYEVSIFLL